MGAGCWRALAQRARRAAGPGWKETGRRLGRAAGLAACVEFLGRRAHARSPPLSLFPAACGVQVCAHRPVTAGRESGGPGVVLLSQKGENNRVPTPTLNPPPLPFSSLRPGRPLVFSAAHPPSPPPPHPSKRGPGQERAGGQVGGLPHPSLRVRRQKSGCSMKNSLPLDLRPPHHSFQFPACQRPNTQAKTAEQKKKTCPGRDSNPRPCGLQP